MLLVFAFGTLKRTWPLHERGLAGASYEGVCRTVERYPMFIAGSFYGPTMVDEPGVGEHVLGELYAVEEATLPLLREIERVGEPGNFEIEIEVEMIGDGARRRSIAFTKARDLYKPVHTGYLADYQDRRFIPPEQRS